MTELTTRDSPVRVAVYAQDKCILVNRPDALIVLCFCGGAKSIVMHVQQSEARLPPLQQCTCDESLGLSTGGENMWTSGRKVESMYAHLKREE